MYESHDIDVKIMVRPKFNDGSRVLYEELRTMDRLIDELSPNDCVVKQWKSYILNAKRALINGDRQTAYNISRRIRNELINKFDCEVS